MEYVTCMYVMDQIKIKQSNKYSSDIFQNSCQLGCFLWSLLLGYSPWCAEWGLHYVGGDDDDDNEMNDDDENGDDDGDDDNGDDDNDDGDNDNHGDGGDDDNGIDGRWWWI